MNSSTASCQERLFTLKVLIEKYRKGQKELHCVFVDPEKADDTVPRKELIVQVEK